MAHNRLAKMLFNDDSDDEFHLLAIMIKEEEMVNEDRTPHRSGSISGHVVIQRDRVQGNDKLYRDYFADTPTFGPRLFWRRILAYGVLADYVDEYVRICESTAIESLKKFVKVIIAVFDDEYLRSPNSSDIANLLEINNDRGFPRMLGSIDCMHWKWKNCPVAWQGSLDDINVLERSIVFKDLAKGRGPHINYSINGHEYTMRYYLADGIYPSWSTFVKTLSSPQGNKNKHFAACQESARKDVEQAFEVFQSHFAIVRGPARFWDQETLNYIMKACIIMHNMIIEDERYGDHPDFNYDVIDEN